MFSLVLSEEDPSFCWPQLKEGPLIVPMFIGYMWSLETIIPWNHELLGREVNKKQETPIANRKIWDESNWRSAKDLVDKSDFKANTDHLVMMFSDKFIDVTLKILWQWCLITKMLVHSLVHYLNLSHRTFRELDVILSSGEVLSLERVFFIYFAVTEIRACVPFRFCLGLLVRQGKYYTII